MENNQHPVMCDSTSQLENHSTNHIQDEKFSCKDCGDCFSDEAELLEHFSTHEHTKSDSNKNGQQSLIRSYFKHYSPTKTHACEFCDKSYTKKSHVKRHVQKQHPHIKLTTVHKVRINLSDDSDIEVSTINDFNEMDTVKKYTCKRCKKSYSRKSHLTRHLLTHSKGATHVSNGLVKSHHKKKDSNGKPSTNGAQFKKYACEICFKSYNRSSHLKRHSYTHCAEKPFVCEDCGKGFAQKYHLDRHYGAHERNTILSFSPVIKRAEPNVRKYRAPKSFEHKALEYNQSPEVKSIIDEVKNIIEDKKPESEDEEQESEAEQESDDHESEEDDQKSDHDQESGDEEQESDDDEPLKPSTENDVICKFCNKSYSQMSSLYRHRRLAHPKGKATAPQPRKPREIVKPGHNKFFCEECDKSFSRRPRLDRHLLNHHQVKASIAVTKKPKAKTRTQQAGFSCDVCSKIFNLRNTLNRHKQRAHGRLKANRSLAQKTVMHFCTRCDKSYARKSHLSRHFRFHHGESFVSEKHSQKDTDQRESSPESDVLQRFTSKASGKYLLSRAIILIAHKRSLTCNVCNKTFSLKSHLKEHRLMHEKEENNSSAEE